MRAKKSKPDKNCTSFEANYQHESTSQYPYLLCLSLGNSDEQFEQTRSMKMLGDWVGEYEKMSEALKYRYANYIPKILKVLLNKYREKFPMEYCLSRFILTFFSSWNELTSAMISNLKESDTYTMELLWYTCHNLVEQLNAQKQPLIIQYLASNFEEPLLYFEPSTTVQARKVLEMVFLMNIHGCQQSFKRHSKSWSRKFQLFLEASSGDLRLTILIDIIKNKNFLLAEEDSHWFWVEKVEQYLQLLEKRAPNMHIKDPLAKQLLDLMLWLLDIKQIRTMLKENQKRFIITLLKRTKPLPQSNMHIFHDPKYHQIREILYDIFFMADRQATQQRLNSLLEQFSSHSYFVLNDEANQAFLECLSEGNIKLQKNLLTDVIKLLSSSHVRRALSARVLIVIAKTVFAALQQSQLPMEVVGQCMKAFNDSIGNKINDPMIGQLRQIITTLYLGIMERYLWEDGYKNEAILNFCQDYERNSKLVNKNIFQILYLLVEKFGFSNETKLQPLINDLFYKSLTEAEHLQSLISLLVMLSNKLKFSRATALIQELCAKNPSKYSSFFLFQALTLAQLRVASDADLNIVQQIIADPALWDTNRFEINLMMIEILFMKTHPPESMTMLRRIDLDLTEFMEQKYQEGNYRLLALVAGKVLGAAGGDPDNLQSLSSYRWLREFSFDMLARSFYKSTSIHVCYIFSNIILRSEKPAGTIRWLCKDQFLDYLYQGLNDFISKEKVFTLQLATSILVYKLLLAEPELVPPQSRLMNFSTLIKNVSWWDENKNEICFAPYNKGQIGSQCILPEFRTYYETTMSQFLRDYLTKHAQLRKKAAEGAQPVHEEDI